MSTIWITPNLATPGEYSYNATIVDDAIKAWLHLQDGGRGYYDIGRSFEKTSRARGPLGTRQLEHARTLAAELEPLFLAAIQAAGFRKVYDPMYRKERWTRA